MPWPAPRSTATAGMPEEGKHSGCDPQDESNFFAIRSILDDKVRNNVTLLNQLAGIFSDENHPLKQVVVTYKLFIPKDDDECSLDYAFCNHGQAYSLESNDTSCPSGYYCITTDRFIWARYPATARDIIFRDLDACPLVVGDYRQEKLTIYFNISAPPSCSSILLDNSSIVREEFPCGWNCNFKRSEPSFHSWHPRDTLGDDAIKIASYIDEALLRITAKLLQYAMSKDNLPGFSYSPDDYLGYASKYVYSRYFHHSVAHAEYAIFLVAYALLNWIITLLILCNYGKLIIEKVSKLCSGCKCCNSCTKPSNAQGNNAVTLGNNVIAHGNNAVVHVNNAVAHGNNAVVHVNNAVAHGNNAVAHGNNANPHGNNPNAHENANNDSYDLALFSSFIVTSLILFIIILLTALAEGGVCVTVMQSWVIFISLFFGILSSVIATVRFGIHVCCSDDKKSRKTCNGICLLQAVMCMYIVFFPHVILMLFFFAVVSFIYNPSGTSVLIIYFCSSSVILWTANTVAIHLFFTNIMKAIICMKKKCRKQLVEGDQPSEGELQVQPNGGVTGGVRHDEGKDLCCEILKQLVFACSLFFSSNLMNLSIMPFIADYYYDKRVDISVIFSALIPAVITVVGWYFGSTLIDWMKAQDGDGLLKDIGGILKHLLELFKKLHKTTESKCITGKIQGNLVVVGGQFEASFRSHTSSSASSVHN